MELVGELAGGGPDDDRHLVSLSNMEQLPDEVVDMITARHAPFRLHRSRTARQEFFCQCGANFGDFFLHSPGPVGGSPDICSTSLPGPPPEDGTSSVRENTGQPGALATGGGDQADEDLAARFAPRAFVFPRAGKAGQHASSTCLASTSGVQTLLRHRMPSIQGT